MCFLRSFQQLFLAHFYFFVHKKTIHAFLCCQMMEGIRRERDGKRETRKEKCWYSCWRTAVMVWNQCFALVHMLGCCYCRVGCGRPINSRFRFFLWRSFISLLFFFKEKVNCDETFIVVKKAVVVMLECWKKAALENAIRHGRLILLTSNHSYCIAYQHYCQHSFIRLKYNAHLINLFSTCIDFPWNTTTSAFSLVHWVVEGKILVLKLKWKKVRQKRSNTMAQLWEQYNWYK